MLLTATIIIAASLVLLQQILPLMCTCTLCNVASSRVVFREIVDNHEKENALNIVTDERTYQVFAESPEDAR